MEQLLRPKTVSFDSNGGTPLASQLLFKGQTVRYPAVPEKKGAAFDRWYEDNGSFKQPWNFDNVPSTDIVLYAKWIKDAKGGVGDGSADNPHLIDNSSSLQGIGTGDYLLSDHYELAADIIWDGDFQPIGSDNDQFTGSFNGNGYSISNITINNDDQYQGMFAEIGTTGVVKNVALTIMEIPTAYRQNIGAVTAANYGTIENVYVVGKIGHGTVNVGGIAGNNFGLIRNCFVAVTDMSAGTSVGGIAGLNGDGGRIENCIALNDKIEASNTGRITGSSTGTGTLSNNYAWKEMDIVTAAVSRQPDPNPKGKDGENVTSAELKTQQAWENAGFTFSASDSLWQWNGDAGFPSFRGGSITEWSSWL